MKNNYDRLVDSMHYHLFFKKFNETLLANSFKRMIVPEHVLLEKLKEEFAEVLTCKLNRNFEDELIDLSIMCLLCFMRNRGYRDD